MVRARRLPRRERAKYRSDATLMARIDEATTPKTRLNAGADYLKAAMERRPDLAEQASTEGAMALADIARRLTFEEGR